MTLAEQILQQVQTLPGPLKQEVLDVVVFLRQRSERSMMHDFTTAQEQGLAAIWEHDADEVWHDVANR